MIKYADYSGKLKLESIIRKAMEEPKSVNFSDNISFDSKSRFVKLCEYVQMGNAKVLVAFLNSVFAGYVWYFDKDMLAI